MHLIRIKVWIVSIPDLCIPTHLEAQWYDFNYLYHTEEQTDEDLNGFFAKQHARFSKKTSSGRCT